MLLRTSVLGFANRVYRSLGSLWVPAWDAVIPRHRNVLAVLGTPRGKLLFAASNIVTNDGDVHYAQKIPAESPTNAFTTHELASAGTPGKAANRSSFTEIASTQKVDAATYPKSNDADPDNTGAGTDVVTHLASYSKADFSATGITHGMKTNATPGASEPLLTGYAFAASFDKTANDTLKVFVNHKQNGV